MGAIRSLLEGGVLQAMPTGGKSISADELAAKTGVDKALIGTVPDSPTQRWSHELTVNSATHAGGYPRRPCPGDRRGAIRPHALLGDLFGATNASCV